MSLLLTFPHSSHTPTPQSHGDDDANHLDGGDGNAKLPSLLPIESSLLNAFPLSSTMDNTDDTTNHPLHLQQGGGSGPAGVGAARPKRERRKRIPFDPVSAQQQQAIDKDGAADSEEQIPPAKRFASSRKGKHADRERERERERDNGDVDDYDRDRSRQRRRSPDADRSEDESNGQKRGKGRRKSLKGHKDEKVKKDEYSASPPLSSRLSSNDSPNIRSRRRRRSRDRDASDSSRSNSDDSRSRSRSRSPSPPASPSAAGAGGGRGRSARLRSEKEKDATLLMLETALAHRKLTSDETREYKKLKRRKQNREAAATSRQRKKAYMSTLEERVKFLRQDKVRLLEKIQELKKENDQLRKQVGQQVDDQDNDDFLQQMMEDRDRDSEEEKPRRSRTSPHQHQHNDTRNHHQHHSTLHSNHANNQSESHGHTDADGDNMHEDSEQENPHPQRRGADLEQEAESFEAAVAEDDEDEGSSAIIDKFIGKSKRRRGKAKQMTSPDLAASKEKNHIQQQQQEQEQDAEQAREQHTSEVSESHETTDVSAALEISVSGVSEQDTMQQTQRAQLQHDDSDAHNRKANHSRDRRVKREKNKKTDLDNNSAAPTPAASSSTSAILLEGQEVDDRTDMMNDDRGALAIIKTEANSHSSSDDEAMASTLASLSHPIHTHRIPQQQIPQSTLGAHTAALERHTHHPQLTTSSSLTSTLSVGGSLSVGRPRSNQNTPSLSFYPSISLSPRFGSLNMPSPNSSSFALSSPGTGVPVHTVTNTPPAFSLTSNANYAPHTAAHTNDFSSSAAAAAAAVQPTHSAHIHPMPLNLPSPRLRETSHSLLALHSMQAQNHSHPAAASAALSSLALLSSSALSNAQSAALANSS